MPLSAIVHVGQDFIMKSYNNLYDQLCLMKNLRIAYKKARKGKSSKWYVIEFEKDLQNNLLQLQKELQNMTYEPKPLKTFVIRDPKSRIISASDFRDRVVHHALCNIIEPIFEKIFIFDSYANRKRKGTHAAIKRFDCFKRKVSKSGRLIKNAKNNNMVIGYVLKADIKHYFDTVDHEVLMKIIGRKIRDEKILMLIRKILSNHNCKVSGKGMPIGNLTSQFFANIYLNELDYFIKYKLKAKYYIRYVDDFLILHRNRTVLEGWKKEINDFLTTIKLELHSEKSKIYPLHKGVNFLGFHIFYYYKLLKKNSPLKFVKRMEYLIELKKEGRITPIDIMNSINGWLAYAKWANTYKLRSKLLKNVK